MTGTLQPHRTHTMSPRSGDPHAIAMDGASGADTWFCCSGMRRGVCLESALYYLLQCVRLDIVSFYATVVSLASLLLSTHEQDVLCLSDLLNNLHSLPVASEPQSQK